MRVHGGEIVAAILDFGGARYQSTPEHGNKKITQQKQATISKRISE